MGKKWVELLYNNQTSQTTYGTHHAIEEFEPLELIEHPRHFDPDFEESREGLLMRDLDFRVLDTLERMNRQPDLTAIDESLKRLKGMMTNISLEMRLHVLSEFNALLRTLSYSHSDDKKIFRHCLEIIIDFKRSMDREEQAQGQRNKAEWIQLEKSIYYLTVWEGQMGSSATMRN